MSVEKHVDELIPGYVLGCLDDEDTIRVAEHVATCPACREEIAQYEELVGDLGLAAREVAPPARVKQRLMQRVRTTEESSSAVEERPAPGVSLWGRIQALSRRLSPALTLLSLALVIVLSVTTLVMWQRIGELQQRSARGMPTILLTGTEAAPEATGWVVVSLDGTHGTLVVDSLPPLDEEQQYQLWLIKDGERTSGAVLSVNDEGYGSVWVSSSDPLASYTDFGVTLEPAGGSPGPTGPKVLGTTS